MIFESYFTNFSERRACQLRRMPKWRSSQNSDSTHSGEGSNLSKGDIRLYLDGTEQRRFYYGRATGNLSYHPGMLSSGTHTVEIVATAGQGTSTSRKSWTFTVS
jgi:hypothetical protein